MRFFALSFLAAACFATELKVPDDVIIERDVDYSSITHGKLAMDIVRPKAKGNYPGIVMIHGGGFNGGKRDSYLPMAIRLAQNGYVAATISYRLTPMYQFPIPLYDPDVYQDGKMNGRGADLVSRNWIGFFVESINGNEVTGRLVPITGVIDSNAGPAPEGVFPRAIRLVK